MVFMSCDNKCILIIGLIIGGLASIYINNTDLASVIFGGLIGYLSHGVSSGVIGVNSFDDGVNGIDDSVSSVEDSVNDDGGA